MAFRRRRNAVTTEKVAATDPAAQALLSLADAVATQPFLADKPWTGIVLVLSVNKDRTAILPVGGCWFLSEEITSKIWGGIRWGAVPIRDTDVPDRAVSYVATTAERSEKLLDLETHLLLQISRSNAGVTVELEYGGGNPWVAGPKGMNAMIESLRPA